MIKIKLRPFNHLLPSTQIFVYKNQALFILQANKKMDPPQPHNDHSLELMSHFHFTADQLNEIQDFCCSCPDTIFGRSFAGCSVFYN